MSEHHDYSLISHINLHYSDLMEDLVLLDSLDSFVSRKDKRRAILFDFLQIGELLNQLSKQFLRDFACDDAVKIIAMRNRIVHGYSTVRDDIIFSTLKNDLPGFVSRLNSFSRERYFMSVKSLLGRSVNVQLTPASDSSDGQAILGYCKDLSALDGEYQGAYVLGVGKTARDCIGAVIAISHRLDDIKDMLILIYGDGNPTKEEIEVAITFEESRFQHELITK